jgi:hypothetical protein
MNVFDYIGGGLPPSVKNMDKQISNQNTKFKQEMNRKHE